MTWQSWHLNPEILAPEDTDLHYSTFLPISEMQIQIELILELTKEDFQEAKMSKAKLKLSLELD